MRTLLRCLALLLSAGSLGWWLAAGAHGGWTQTQVPVKELDPVTGIEAVRYQDRVIPGIDILAVSDLLALGLFVVSCAIKRPSTIHTQS